VAALVALEPSIQTAITTEKQAGHRPGAVEKLYQKLVTLLGTLETSLQGSSTALLALTPQQDAAAPAAFASSASTLTTAASQLGTARADVQRILKDLGGS
jgi:outer membrane lipoprotein-sorting protein